MVSHDGTMKLSTDKAAVLHVIEKLFTPVEPYILQSNDECCRVIIFDGMAVVNKIKKTDTMRTCNDFAKAFVDYLIYESKKM